MYGLALFDLDGTLTDPKEGITRAVRHALNAFGIKPASLDELTGFIGPPLREALRARYGFSPEDTERAVAGFREYFTARGMFENKVYPGIPRMLERLASRGVRMAVATSKPMVYAQKIVAHFGLDGFFSIVAGCELDGRRSRKGEVIRFAMEAVGPARPLPAVMVGDREHDIIGAAEAGMDGIGVTWGYGTLRELERAGAAAVADTPEALFGLIAG